MHPTRHLFATLVAVGVAIALTAVVRNRVIRRRLFVSGIMLLAIVALHFAILGIEDVPALAQHGPDIEKVLGAFAVINGLVALFFNPWFEDRISDRAPAIVQDALIATLVVAVSMLALNNSSFLTGSAIAAAVLGFALQDTLGNLFAGLAIQIEKPFRVGHWITVGSFEGMVVAVTWRATKIRTKNGNLVIVPNNVVGKESINNYSEPTAPTRLFVEVGASYDVPPNEVRAAIMNVLSEAKHVLKDPPYDAVLYAFADSSITYRARFWINDYSRGGQARDSVRTGIYYEFKRRGIEIPWPIQIQYERDEKAPDRDAERRTFRDAIMGVPVLASLPPEAHEELASHVREQLYGNGEVIVREGEPGASMFLISHGRVRIVVGPERREVAVTDAGGYFGEMSLLTGDARTATVIASGDTRVIEIGASQFSAYLKANPHVIDQLAQEAADRRREIAEARGTSAPSIAAESISLAKRMREFFGLD